MDEETLNAYGWLISQQAAPWLERLACSAAPAVMQVPQLRKTLTATQTHLLIELIELRQRAMAKFDAAHRLFFTPVTLEQATDQAVAACKAARFPEGQPIADLCCGIGGDLFGLAERGEASGVDLDPIHSLLAEANCRELDLPTREVMTADATMIPLEHFAAWHIDPDRRATGRRATRLDRLQPTQAALQQMLSHNPHGAIKLAPATMIPEPWPAMCERQWIGSGRECRQQVLWFGALAHHAGQHTARLCIATPRKMSYWWACPTVPSK